jgi:hypothetical protein
MAPNNRPTRSKSAVLQEQGEVLRQATDQEAVQQARRSAEIVRSRAPTPEVNRTEIETLGGGSARTSIATTLSYGSTPPRICHLDEGYGDARQAWQVARGQRATIAAADEENQEEDPEGSQRGSQHEEQQEQAVYEQQRIQEPEESEARGTPPGLTEEQDRLAGEEHERESSRVQTGRLFQDQQRVLEAQRQQGEERRRQSEERLAQERRAREMAQAMWNESENLRLNAESLRQHYQDLAAAEGVVWMELRAPGTEAQRAEQWRRLKTVQAAINDAHMRIRWNDTLVARARQFQAVADLAMRVEPAGALYFATGEMDTSP